MRWLWRFLRGACTQCGMIPAPTLWRRPRCGFCIAEGWVHAHCMEGGKVHPHPHDPNQVCTRYLYGQVEVVMPKEAR
jgi:hypothetical protein